MCIQLDTQTGNKITEISAMIFRVFLLKQFDLILTRILYLKIGSEFEEKVIHVLYAYVGQGEKVSVSHGLLSLLCFCQRVEELEKENALLKSEKEEINLILQQSQTSAGNN